MAKQRQKKGFSLVEVLVAIAILSAMAAVSSGIYLAFSNSQLRARAAQNILSTSQYALEGISREIRNSVIVNYDGVCPLALMDGTLLTNCLILQKEDASYFAYVYYSQQLYYILLQENNGVYGAIDFSNTAEASVLLGFANNLLVSQWRTRVVPASDPFASDPEPQYMYQPRVTIFLASSYPGNRSVENVSYFFQTTVVSRIYKK